MKKLLLLSSLFLISSVALASHMVRGYVRKGGALIQPHKSMNPGESKKTALSYHTNLLIPRA